MKKQLNVSRIGGLVTLFICMVGLIRTHFHNVFLDILFVCVALASLVFSAMMRRRYTGSR